MDVHGDRNRRSRRRCGIATVLVWVMLAVTITTPGASPAAASPTVRISDQSQRILQNLLDVRNAIGDNPAQRSETLSRQFLGTPYGANTLIGSAEEPEQLVVELQKVDCFTYADYLEALKRADNREEFIDGLVDVRYKDGVVAFRSRKHFFTDWAASTPAIATDITATLSPDAAQATKTLNERDSGGLFVPGLPTTRRTITYIPTERIDSGVLDGLRTGDYIGAYATDGGLDVTHVGIFIDTPDGPVFRNASSRSASHKVVDSPLHDYLQTVPGMVVLRPVR